MDSNSTRIPLIDFSGSYSDIKVRVIEALPEYGCFEAIFSDITEEYLRPLLAGVQELLELPEETKKKCPPGEILPGFLPKGQYGTLYQSIGLDNPLELQNFVSMAKALWPADSNPKLCKMLHSYSQKIQMYDQMVRKIVAESLGIDAYLDEHIGSSHYTVRGNKYDPPKSGNAEFGLIPHCDGGYLTILIQCEDKNGLQVQTKDGNWFDVNPLPYNFVVMAGTPLGVWTNGRVRPCNHQVIMCGNQPRYSLAFASTIKPGYYVVTPGELIDENHPQLFEPYEYIEQLHHRQARSRQAGWLS